MISILRVFFYVHSHIILSGYENCPHYDYAWTSALSVSRRVPLIGVKHRIVVSCPWLWGLVCWTMVWARFFRFLSRFFAFLTISYNNFHVRQVHGVGREFSQNTSSYHLQSDSAQNLVCITGVFRVQNCLQWKCSPFGRFIETLAVF